MTIAVYAGTFDPVTLGHLSVVRRAVRFFSHVRVLVAVNPEKATLFDVPTRLDLLRRAVAAMPTVSVDATTGWVVDHARSIGAGALVRGMRGESDAVFETRLARENERIAPELATVLLPADADLAGVSSSELKALFAAGRDVTAFAPPHVVEALAARFAGVAA